VNYFPINGVVGCTLGFGEAGAIGATAASRRGFVPQGIKRVVENKYKE
jgi:hypothetical protein